MYDLIIKNGKLVTPDRVYEADIAVKDGKYAAFLAPGTEAEATEVIDAEGNLVYPGIIDCHAHLNEPGFDYREDFVLIVVDELRDSMEFSYLKNKSINC